MFLLIVSSCTKNNVAIKQNGIIVTIPKGQVAFEVYNDNIVRCVTNSAQINDSVTSKIVNMKPEKVDWQVIEENNQVGILTNMIKAMVDKNTGAIRYYNSNNKLLIAEPSVDGRVFGENIIYGNKTQFAYQTFLSDEGEAIYGLGQNHTDKLNLKGSSLDLYQRNSETYIPFLVSSKNYGILWDNYAYTKLGAQNNAHIIPDSVFEDNSSISGKLSAEFFSDVEFQTKVKYEGWNGSMLFDDAIDKSNNISSIRLSGKINIDEDGEYEFIKEKIGKLSLYIDGDRVMQYWQSILNTPRYSHVNLTKGEHEIVIEYTQIKESYPILSWRKPSEINKKEISIWSASARNIDYFFIYGETNMDEVISGFRQLTGKASLLPKWAYGFWQSRNRYKTQKEIENVASKLRTNKIPYDNIVLDWCYWPNNQWGSHDFSAGAFPEPEKMIKNIHDLKTNIMISVWPKFYPNTQNYKELEAAGALYTKYADEKKLDFRKKLNTYYDPFNPKGREIYWNQINRSLYKYGIDAWWLDATEPSFDKDFNAETRAYYMEPNAFGKGYDYLNLFPLYTSKAVYEGQRSVDPNKRVFILTRSAFAGMQSYAGVAWSGDIAASWDLFKQEIACGLSFSLSGMPYWTDDVGGYISEERNGTFFYNEFEELFTRWFQFGTFCPIFRVHGDQHAQTMWSFKEKYYNVQLKFDKLRYKLLPYIYSVAGAVTHEDYTMMRGLVFDFANDPKVLNIADEYMFGPSLLICPVTEYEVSKREVYLPATTDWYDFWTGKYYEGGKTYIVAAPFDEMPIFVKAGSIIPFCPELQYSSEKKANTILLRVYNGNDAEFKLYEDEGINYNYEQGKFTEIKISWNEKEQQLHFADLKGMFEGMLENRTFQVELISKENMVGYNNIPLPSKQIEYVGKNIQVSYQ